MTYIYHYTSTLDSTYDIQSLEDMARVEERMSQIVYGEKGRCSILNSAAYTRLRLAALYERSRFMCMRIRHNNVTLELMGQKVSIFIEQGDKCEEISRVQEPCCKKAKPHMT